MIFIGLIAAVFFILLFAAVVFFPMAIGGFIAGAGERTAEVDAKVEKARALGGGFVAGMGIGAFMGAFFGVVVAFVAGGTIFQGLGWGAAVGAVLGGFALAAAFN